MSRLKRKLPFFFITAIITPGMVIGLLGIYFVSQQKRARELELYKEYTSRIVRIRDSVEKTVFQKMEAAFKTTSESEIDFTDADSVMTHTRRIALNNPIIKNPFFINPEGKYLFPVSRKASFPAGMASSRQVMAGAGESDYAKAENLEFKKREFVDAIRLYLRYLKENPGKRSVRPYVYNAIARCYFKLNKYRQAVTYYKRILGEYSALLAEDNALHFLVLRQAARAHTFRGNKRDALRVYLDLYENILNYESSRDSHPFEFFKNEALDYLNRFAREGETGKVRFSRARRRDQLANATQLDISLGWLYFEDEMADRQIEDRERQTSRFLKLRELYAASDEKTAFYKTIRDPDRWSPTGSARMGMEIEHVGIPGSNIPVDIGFKKIKSKDPVYNDIYFGYMISFEYIRGTVIPGAAAGYLDETSLELSLLNPGRKPGGYTLLSVPFGTISPGKQLVLHSPREDHIRWVVEKEVRLLYGLMSALLAALFLGVYILFKYFSREAELVRLKADFVDSVSHTLKTPLTRMALMAENVEQGWVTNESQKQDFFRTIVRETVLMNEIIDNMLDFSRIDAGKKEYNPEESSLPEIVRAVVDRHVDYIKKNGFEFTIEIDDGMPSLRLDRDAVSLLTANLIQNAVKYSDKEKYIAVRVYVKDGHAVLEVADRGMGIGETDMNNIFKKFYRVSNPTVYAREGSGLGLFIARHAAAAHNGEITVESRVGKGSTFYVYLPFK